MKKILLPLFAFTLSIALAQETVVNPRPVTMAEYEKAKTFSIKDLDQDTYAKFENTYILDRYESRKPYFITGDDGLKKRIDLYKFIAKEGMQELGLMIFYTNEKGKVYKALLPNFTAESKVWEKYFEDIHAIDKEEKNYVLKLSYVLSKEVGYQLYKAANQGKDISKESATYGNDICFPGDQQVMLADGNQKRMADVKAGDHVISVDPATKKSKVIKVNEVVVHEAKNYAVTRLLLVKGTEIKSELANEVSLSSKVIEATPNHPIQTQAGTKEMGKVNEGDKVLCYNPASKRYDEYTVAARREYAGEVQKVYNIVAGEGTPFIMNGVVVLQK
jgi:ribosomal protein S8E